jgi:16S rRNA processing protein RimM
MGRVTAPFGVKGWIKIHALTAHIGNLQEYPVWWLGHEDKWRDVSVIDARVQGSTLVAQLEGVNDRDAAAALKGLDIAVARDELPRAGANEYYWADLIGLKVVNVEHYEFGRVARILQTGANDVLVVEAGDASRHETLIPFIADVVRHVDLAAGEIGVNWGRDY